MDLFTKNPFAGALAAVTVILSIAALYFLYSAHSTFTSESDTYAANTGRLSQLQGARPGPNQENLQALKEELEQARTILERLSGTIAEESAPFDATLTPQKFQDALAEQVDALAAEAEKVGVALPEDFALGFERYRTEPPSPVAAPFLGQQLESIGNVAALLIKARIKSIASFARAPLPQELEENAEDSRATPGEDRLADVTLAPFDILFEADQSNFRDAINSLVAAKPVVFLRLLDVANSQPKAPPKPDLNAPAQSGAEGGVSESSQVPVVFGQESLVVTMRLAAVSANAQSKQD
jgi:hypothetical protein